MSTELESLPDDKLSEVFVNRCAKAATEQSVELAKLRGKVFALEKAGDAMDLLLTGSMKPSKGVREAWESAKKL